LSDSTTVPANDDPNTAPNNRGLKAIVIILGVLIVLAFAALVVGFFSRLSGGRDPAAGGAVSELALPPGSKIIQVQVTTTNRIVMAVQTPTGNEVDIVDTDTGRLIGRIKPVPAH
jgi:flagellar basal body-associated protein FliL